MSLLNQQEIDDAVRAFIRRETRDRDKREQAYIVLLGLIALFALGGAALVAFRGGA